MNGFNSSVAAVSLGLLLWWGSPLTPVFAQGLVYQPPLRGAPAGQARVGGGTRGAEDQAVALGVLAPDHVGLTASKQPILYWFASKPLSAPAEVTIIRQDRIEPVLELVLEPPLKAGLHAIDLAEHGVELDPDVPYQWFVALVVDPEHRSDDIVAGGEVQRTTPSPEVQARLQSAGERDVPLVYAQTGYWYDALDQLTNLIARNPGDTGLKALRDSLLEQVGLSDAVAYTASN